MHIQVPTLQLGGVQNSLAETLDSATRPLPLCGELCEERESFIPAGRNVIISVTDEMPPQAAFYAFLFPLVL